MMVKIPTRWLMVVALTQWTMASIAFWIGKPDAANVLIGSGLALALIWVFWRAA